VGRAWTCHCSVFQDREEHGGVEDVGWTPCKMHPEDTYGLLGHWIRIKLPCGNALVGLPLNSV
jgi:hypothetical protein